MDHSSDLRERAELRLKEERPDHPDGCAAKDLRKVIHDLRVHQIELDMQNEELRRAHAELEISRERYADLFEFAPAGYLMTTAGGVIREANLTIASMLGVPRSELIGNNLLQYVSVDERNGYYAQIAKMKRGLTPAPFEMSLLKTTGETCFARLECRALHQDNDETLYRIIISDVSDRRRAEEALRDREEQFRAMFEAHKASMLLIDPENGRIIRSNHAAREYYGYDAGEFRTLTIFDINQSTMEEIRAEMEKARAEKRNHFDFRHRLSDGDVRPVEVYSSPILFKGKPLLFSIIHDVAARKRAEEALKSAKTAADAASRAKSEFLAHMSHELRTPLNAIIGYGQMLEGDDGLSVAHRESVAIMKKSGEHLLTLIDDILDIAKIEAGKIEIAADDMDVKGLASAAVDILKPRAAEKGVGLHLEIEPDVPDFVKGDEKRLRQVLLNLLSNAVKFTEKGAVVLKAGRRDARTTFSVADTGPGIPEAHAQAIFEPFEQSGASDARKEGTGLGLAISRNLVRLMGGDITVESVPGKGSEFSFDILLPPVKKSGAPEKNAVGNRHIVGYEGRRQKALIVDDIEMNRSLIRIMIERLGFDIEAAESGDEALGKAARFLPDVIFMDLMMPGMQGDEAIRSIRARTPERAPAIIVTTGKTDASVEKKIREIGANDYIAKPIKYDDLLRKLERHLGLTWIWEDRGGA